MSKKQTYSLAVRGDHKLWSFEIKADPSHVADWLADGLVVNRVQPNNIGYRIKIFIARLLGI